MSPAETSFRVPFNHGGYWKLSFPSASQSRLTRELNGNIFSECHSTMAHFSSAILPWRTLETFISECLSVMPAGRGRLTLFPSATRSRVSYPKLVRVLQSHACSLAQKMLFSKDHLTKGALQTQLNPGAPGGWRTPRYPRGRFPPQRSKEQERPRVGRTGAPVPAGPSTTSLGPPLALEAPRRHLLSRCGGGTAAATARDLCCTVYSASHVGSLIVDVWLQPQNPKTPIIR